MCRPFRAYKSLCGSSQGVALGWLVGGPLARAAELVVRLWYSQEFEHRELWRNAAEFASGIRQTDETGGGQVIRWMNVTRHLKARKDKQSRQIIFTGEKLDMEAV